MWKLSIDSATVHNAQIKAKHKYQNVLFFREIFRENVSSDMLYSVKMVVAF